MDSRQEVRKISKGSQGQVDLKRCAARAIFATNTTIRDNNGFSPTQVLLGRAPRLPCIVKPQEVPKEYHTEHTHQACTSHDARETLQAIHDVRAKYRQARTVVQLDNVQKNRTSKYENRQYKPGDSVDFENTLNPQRTCGVIVEQMMTKQYRVRYGNNQYTKVNTVKWCHPNQPA